MGTVNGLVCWGKSEPETPETMDFPIDFPIFCMEISVQAEHVPKTLQQTKPVRVIILAIFFGGSPLENWMETIVITQKIKDVKSH